MAFEVEGFEIIERKDLDKEGVELLLVRDKVRGIFSVVMSHKAAGSETYLGGHNRDQVSNEWAQGLYGEIDTVEEFHRFSAQIRDSIQRVIER